jgi:hypothetical protein
VNQSIQGAEVGKVTLKSNGDEALSKDFFLKKVTAMKREMLSKKSHR